MTLPRFTSGRVGNLDYSHLNEAFDQIESKEAMRRDRRKAAPEVILARLTQRDASGRFAWAEVVRNDDGTYSDVVRGVTSARDGDIYRYYAVAMTGGAQQGDVVLISPRRTKQGKLYYTVNSSMGTVVRMFVIVQSIQHATRSDSWTYIARLADHSVQSGYGGIWSQSSALDYVLVNGAENPTDGTTIGVGTIPPAGVNKTRNPIKVGTVVSAANIDGGWYFSVPNGYTFTCT